ncbi:MAG: hypothetical protein CL868_01785 [Cytophagaceae bacterium]|nr:hypothetical protein [Cytophagaceae bacterium]|tara:strand:+ start:914 stop:1471 length:558 start_codon:yes stop_codon:yes gene_type:complete
MVITLFSLLVQQFNKEYVQPSDISNWFAAKPASQKLLTDLAKYFAQSKELDCRISLMQLAKELVRSKSTKLSTQKTMQDNSLNQQSEDALNASMSKHQLATFFFQQLGNRAVVPFTEAAEIFCMSAGSADAKLKRGEYKDLYYMEVEKENRKSRPLVSVLDLADYYYKKREVVVLGDIPQGERTS